MKHFASILTIAAVAAAMFLLGWWTRGACSNDSEEVSVRIDTVYFERPQCVAATVRPITVNVPRVLFAGEYDKESCKSYTGGSANDKEAAPVVAYSATTHYGEQCANNAQCSGSCSKIPNSSGNLSEFPTASPDSVALALEIETRIYEDTLYRAQVSGPAVGGYHPSLDWIETYSRTQTITRTQTRRNRFAVTAGVGAAYTPRGFQPTIGVQVGIVLWSF